MLTNDRSRASSVNRAHAWSYFPKRACTPSGPVRPPEPAGSGYESIMIYSLRAKQALTASITCKIGHERRLKLDCVQASLVLYRGGGPTDNKRHSKDSKCLLLSVIR